MSKRWIVLGLVCAVTLVLGFGSQSGAAAPQPKIAWSPCFKKAGPFECGTVQVPLDYDSPGSGTISLSVARLPATDPSRKIGSLFINPGGPGGSGVDFLVGAGPFLFSDEVRARFDIVGFDPRGIIRSTSFRCFGNQKQWDPYFTPFAFPMTAAEEAVWITADHYLDNACAQRGSKIGSHMSTANVARDLDALRQAVGDEKLTYAGYSYGTMIGQTYANMFPDRFRAIIIDGVLDPIAWTTGAPGQQNLPFSTRLRSDQGAMDTLEQFFVLCDAGDCAFGPDSEQRYADLVATVKADPSVIDYSNLIGITLGAMYDSSSWPDFAALLPTSSPPRAATQRSRPGSRRSRSARCTSRSEGSRSTRTSSRASPQLRARTASTPTRTRRGRRRVRRPTRRSATSAASGRGRRASAPTGLSPTPTATWARSTSRPRAPSSSSATCTTPRRGIRGL